MASVKVRLRRTKILQLSYHDGFWATVELATFSRAQMMCLVREGERGLEARGVEEGPL